MLPKRYRLKNKAAFVATYNFNKSLSDENVFVYLGKTKTDSETLTRVGVVVSKKIHKRAVKRNRIKRLIREAYRLMLKNGEVDFVQDRLSIIFVGKKGALNCGLSEIKNSIYQLLIKISK